MVSFFEFKLEGRSVESLDVEDPGFEGLGSTWPGLVCLISGNCDLAFKSIGICSEHSKEAVLERYELCLN